jgi:hypothetical protein
MEKTLMVVMRHFYIPVLIAWSFGCGVFSSPRDVVLPAVSTGAKPILPGGTVEIKRSQGEFMLADSSPVYEHPDRASAVIIYLPQGAHEKVTAVEGAWLLIRLPDGKVGFMPVDSVKQK